jgi:hypothetical protein
MTEPQCAARLWLAVAVATLWLLSVRGAAKATVPESTLPDITAVLTTLRRQRRATHLRVVSVFRRGRSPIVVALLQQALLPLGLLRPEPWPTVPVLNRDTMITRLSVSHHAVA